MRYRDLIILPPGLRWPKLLCKPRHGCGRMLPKRIWRGHNISTTGCATMPAPSPNWRLRGERYPMIRVSSNSPATFCGGAASTRKVCRTWSARWSWTRATFLPCNRSRSVTNNCGAMPTQSLPWIARWRSCPTTSKRGPVYGPARCVLGLIDAALGRKELALDEGRRAIALTPVEKDVTNGSFVLQYFAITAAWAGEKELALQQLEAGLRAPAASLALSYGALKLLPFWDPLRGDPRFEKIVASLAPKQ